MKRNHLHKSVSMYITAVSLVVALFSAGTAFGIGLSVSPTNISWNTNTWLDIVITNVTPEAEVNLGLYVDVASNGIIDGQDYLLTLFELQDGLTNEPPCLTMPDDDDGAIDGEITTAISYHGINSLLHGIGSYVWQAVETGGETNTTLFQVTQPTNTVWITGVVRELMTSNLIAGAYVRMEYFFDHRDFAPAAWTGTNGVFQLYVPQGVSTSDVQSVLALKPGYFTIENDENNNYISFRLFTNDLHIGENNIPDPLFLVPAISGQVYTVSGYVYDEVTNGIAGALVQFTSADADPGEEFSIAVSDTNGVFSFPVPGDADGEVCCGDSLLSMRGYMGGFQSDVTVTGDVAGIEIFCTEVDILARATVTDEESGEPITGVKVFFETEEYTAMGFSLTNGYYEIGVIADTNYRAGCESEEDFLPQGYIKPEGYEGVVISNGVYTNASFTADPGYVLSGQVYDENTNGRSGGMVAACPHGSQDGDTDYNAEVNLHGYYEILAPTGTYRVLARDFAGFLSINYTNHYEWDWENSDPVAVTTSGTPNINFYLPQAALISGLVQGYGTNLQGAAVVACAVTTEGQGGQFWQQRDSGTSATNGTYELEVPAATNYGVYAQGSATSYWVRQYYDGVSRTAEATLVTTAPGSPATNIDFDLSLGMCIQGTVLDEGGSPMEDTRVEALITDTNGNKQTVSDSNTDGNGDYRIILSDDTNYAISVSENQQWYPDTYYSNKYSYALADRVGTNTGSVVSNVDFQLFPGYRVEGFIYQSDGTTPIANGGAVAQDAVSNEYAGASTSTSGWYYFYLPTNMPFYVKGRGQDYMDEYYSNAYDLADATNIQSTPMTTVQVDFVLYNWNEDTDGDGLWNYQEDSRPDGVYVPGEDAASYTNQDTDGDGLNDYQEMIIAHTSPTNSDSLLKCVAIQSAGGGMEIQWSSVAGVTNYYLDGLDDLVTGSWFNVTGPISATGPLTSVINTNPDVRFFYRVRITEPPGP